MIPINTAALTLPIAGQAPVAAGADVGAVPPIAIPNGGLVGQTTPGVAELFSMLLAQLTEGKNIAISTPVAADAPSAQNGDSTPSKPSSTKEPSVEQQSTILSLLPVVVALNPELPAVNTSAITDPVSAFAVTPEAPTPVIPSNLSMLRVPALPLSVQSAEPTARAEENHAPPLTPDAAVLVPKQPPDEPVSPQQPITIPDTASASPRAPIAPRVFSTTIGTPDQQTTTTPVSDNSLTSPVPQVDAQQNSTTPSDHLVVPGRLSLTRAEAQSFHKLDLPREPANVRQENVTQQAVPDQLVLGTEKIPVELVAASAPPNHPVDAPAHVSKVIAALPETVPAVTLPRETLHVQLEPSELGRVTLQVSVQSQQVHATVGVEHHGLGQFLTASQGALDDALRQHGLRIEEFRVETIANSDVNGLGAGRTGLDQGSPDHEAFQFQRHELRGNYPEVHLPDIGRTGQLEVASPYRINIFA